VEQQDALLGAIPLRRCFEKVDQAHQRDFETDLSFD
jgi:hypothetical protein